MRNNDRIGFYDWIEHSHSLAHSVIALTTCPGPGPCACACACACASMHGCVQVGMGGRFIYLWPTGGKAPFVPPNRTDTLKINALGMSDQLAIDLHPGGAFDGLNNTEEVLSTPAFKGWAGAMVLETNCGDHTIRRMLIEAQVSGQCVSARLPRSRSTRFLTLHDSPVAWLCAAKTQPTHRF